MYQYASDHFGDMPPASGVIRDDGKWVPVEANNEDWLDYLDWAKDGKNKTLPYKSPADGGYTIKLEEGEEAVGVMLDSLPPPKPAPAPTPQPAAHSTTTTAPKPKS